LSELIQNADDARASTVKVLYNTRSYGTASLLGKKMAKWQGPALCVYNDATFSARDFQNLVKIGQVKGWLCFPPCALFCAPPPLVVSTKTPKKCDF
jgi:hypothetical protein